MSDLQWAMFPKPYLATVEPSAAPGTVVYKLVARKKGGSLEVAQFLLVDGECVLHLSQYSQPSVIIGMQLIQSSS